MYRKILGCLHPDRGASKEMLAEAFNEFKKLEVVLVDNTELPTMPAGPGRPTLAEMMALKENVKEARRAKRNSGSA
jgi:hypothetical protein